MGMDTLSDNSVKIVFARFWKEVYSEMKELFPSWEQSLSFKIKPFFRKGLPKIYQE